MPKGIPKNYIPKEPSKFGGGKREGAGRKKLKIDWKQVEKFLMQGCSGVEIAAYLEIHPQTLYDNCVKVIDKTWADYSYEKRKKGNVLLFGAQYKKALEGDNTQLIWLGKYRLSQTDKIEQNLKVSDEVPQKKILSLPDNGRRSRMDYE